MGHSFGATISLALTERHSGMDHDPRFRGRVLR